MGRLREEDDRDRGGCWTFDEDGWFGWPVVEASVLSAERGEAKVRVGGWGRGRIMSDGLGRCGNGGCCL